MSCKSIKPSKTFSMTVDDNMTELDTKGCDCRLKALGGEVYVYSSPNNAEMDCYTLFVGETVTFCGKLYLNGDGEVCGMMYTTV